MWKFREPCLVALSGDKPAACTCCAAYERVELAKESCTLRAGRQVVFVSVVGFFDGEVFAIKSFVVVGLLFPQHVLFTDTLSCCCDASAPVQSFLLGLQSCSSAGKVMNTTWTRKSVACWGTHANQRRLRCTSRVEQSRGSVRGTYAKDVGDFCSGSRERPRTTVA